jgi:uncharacterized protein YjbJ (UPF0337 family)
MESLLSTLKDKAMNKNQANGAVKEIAGKVQQEVGKLVGNNEQQVKGLSKQLSGKAENFTGMRKKQSRMLLAHESKVQAMRNSVNNQIELIGNEKIDWLVDEMIKRIEIAYAKREEFHHDYKLVGEVFYGKSVDDKLTKEEIGSDWICLPEGYDSHYIRGLLFFKRGHSSFRFSRLYFGTCIKVKPQSNCWNEIRALLSTFYWSPLYQVPQ